MYKWKISNNNIILNYKREILFCDELDHWENGLLRLSLHKLLVKNNFDKLNLKSESHLLKGFNKLNVTDLADIGIGSDLFVIYINN